MKLFFWGQFNKAEFALPFCMAWERQIGPVEHFCYRKAVAEASNPEPGFVQGLAGIKTFKPQFVVNWQGHEMDEEKSKRLRETCEEVGAKFIFISLDDPFYLHHWKPRPYAHAHCAVTCCMEARQIYNERGVKDVIFAPPACSIDLHFKGLCPRGVIKSGVFYFFTNPYIGPVFEEYGAINRLETIRQLLAKQIPVELASVQHLYNHNYLTKEEWGRIGWKGFVPYEGFRDFNNLALHFNSAVVGQKYIYFNQRVFEILGIGGIQTLDASPGLQGFFKVFCEESGIRPSEMPFIFYNTPTDHTTSVEVLLGDPAGAAARRAAARHLRWSWTFDHIVRRIAYGEETVFDRYEATQK